jgi:hypothetical protein
VDVECAHCGSKQLQQLPGTWTPLLTEGKGAIPGPSIPMVVIGCPTCGFVSLFSPQAISPQPFPPESIPEEFRVQETT